MARQLVRPAVNRRSRRGGDDRTTDSRSRHPRVQRRAKGRLRDDDSQLRRLLPSDAAVDRL